MLETLTKDNWTKYVGESFPITAGNSDTFNLKLTEVTGYGNRQGGNREAFSILFCGPLQPVLPQSIYRFEHDDFGELAIFLVPIGPQPDGMGYEAVFT
jgi:hypothetical protein